MIKRAIILLIGLVPALLYSQNVSNVVIQQVGKQIEVSYYTDSEADIKMTATLDNRMISCKTVSGDVGINIPAGSHHASWDVLSDVNELTGELKISVSASMSTRKTQELVRIANRKAQKEKRMEGVSPMGGFDVQAGYAGVGAAIYWPWVTKRPSRVGSYIAWTMGMKDWKNEDVDMFNNIFLGATVALTKHTSWFFAPGLSIINNSYDVSFSQRYASLGNDTYTINRTIDESEYKFAAQTGFGFKVLSIFLVTLQVEYPWYIGLGLGLNFSF